jgi:hypothetical protein
LVERHLVLVRVGALMKLLVLVRVLMPLVLQVSVSLVVVVVVPSSPQVQDRMGRDCKGRGCKGSLQALLLRKD